MRKLKLQMQTSIDGFVSTGPNDEQHWVTWAWDEIKPTVLNLIDTTDTIVIGRKLAVDYIPHWQNVVKNSDDPMYELAQRIISAKKILFSNTLIITEWENTELAKGNLADEINKLKNQSGKDMIVYGGSSFVASLIEHELIDEFHLYVNPVVLSTGVPIFNKLKEFRKLKLISSIPFDCGIVLLHYKSQNTK